MLRIPFRVMSMCMVFTYCGLSAAAPLLSVDFDGNSAIANEFGPSQAGFVSFDSAGGASQMFGALTVSLTPGVADGRDRGAIAQTGTFTQSDLLRDFAFTGASTTATISGLTPGGLYNLSVWSYEHILLGATFTEDVFANGVLVADNFQYSVGAPTTNEQYRINFLATATGAGAIAILLTTPPADDTVVRLNGLEITAVPEPTSLLLCSLALGVVSVVRRRPAG